MPGEGLARRFRALSALLIGLCAACARPAVAPTPVSQPDPCLIAPPPVVAAESLSIAFAVEAANGISAPTLLDASRIVSALLSETFVRVDCSGDLRPLLAHKWELDSSAGTMDGGPTIVAVDSMTPDLRLIELSPGTDMRDMVDRGVDLLFTEDPAVARYALTRTGLAVHALPPRRSYTVVTVEMAAPADSLDVELHTLRVSLADDVVQVPARPASSLEWWSDTVECGLSEIDAPPASSRLLPRVAYRSDDPVARAIAGRLVSLASRGGHSLVNGLVGSTVQTTPGPVAAEALSATDFARALRERTRAAFIVSVVARPLASCSAAADLAAAMPWAFTNGIVRAGVITPLIEAGGWAIVRRGAVGISADWDGTPRLVFSSSRTRNGSR